MKTRLNGYISEYLFTYVTHYSNGVPHYSRKWLNIYDAVSSTDKLIKEQVDELLKELQQDYEQTK